MKGITILGILILVLSTSFVQAQEVCPHTDGWEKSGENEQHVTIIIEGSQITFIPEEGWTILSICFKAGTDVYYQSIGGTSETVVVVNPSGQDISHGAALMSQPTATPTNEPTFTPEPSNTPVPSNTPTDTATPPLTPTEPPITPYPTIECQIEHCGGKG